MLKRLLSVAFCCILFMPDLAFACACGCGSFDVSTSSMLPTDKGGSVWVEYDFLNQSDNRHNASSSPGYANNDKQIRTDFITAGGQYMFNRSWGISIAVPYQVRHFKTQDSDTGDINHFSSNDLGDVRLQAIYSGLFDDMSSGITFGIKLPTGQFTTPGFDRDTEIGSGSTDMLIGLYHQQYITDDAMFSWFTHGQWQRAVSIQNSYRPGDDFNIATGIYYNGWTIETAGKIAPLLQIIGSHRLHDTGVNASPDNTGYTRMLLSPGVEYSIADIKLYGDIETPVYQNMKGQQLVAPVALKFIVSYNF